MRKNWKRKWRSTLLRISEGKIAHSVIVVDGKDLGVIESSNDRIATIFSELLVKVDSVIVCRASPSQKASMVKGIRHRIPGSMTLAIGDGGNDIAMIQEAHVGVGHQRQGRPTGSQSCRLLNCSIQISSTTSICSWALELLSYSELCSLYLLEGDDVLLRSNHVSEMERITPVLLSTRMMD